LPFRGWRERRRCRRAQGRDFAPERYDTSPSTFEGLVVTNVMGCGQRKKS